MGCCKCSCTKVLEHVDQVIHDYDPQENFLNYKVATLWINRKTKKAWVLVSKEGGIAVWHPIPLEQSAIDKIILDCGEVTPNENGEIIHKGACGARTVPEGCTDFCITLETGWGLKGGGTVCAGEKTKVELDPENINLVTSSSTGVKDGDSVVFDGDSGRIIKRAMNWRVGNGTDSWTGRFNESDKSFQIFPNEMSDKPIIQMLNNGVILQPWYPKCTAILNQRTPNFTAGLDYEIGSTRAFVKLRDTDGYEQSANNFFPGDGNGNSAYYTCPYTGGYSIGWLFLADRTIALDNKGEIFFKLIFGPVGNPKVLLYRYFFGSLTYSTVSSYITLPLDKGDRIRWNINIKDIPQGTPYINSITQEGQIDNFIGILFTG